MTGHYYFRDFYYADNGFIPALRILELMSKKNQPRDSALDIPAEPVAGWQYLLARSARLGPLCGRQRVQNSRNKPHSGPTAHRGAGRAMIPGGITNPAPAAK